MKHIKPIMLLLLAVYAFPANADTDKLPAPDTLQNADKAELRDSRDKVLDTIHDTGLNKHPVDNSHGTQNPENNFGVHGLAPEGTKKMTDGDPAKLKKPLSGLEDHSINTGGNNKGTFGDERLNMGRRTDSNDFRGNGNGNASDDRWRSTTRPGKNEYKGKTYDGTDGLSSVTIKGDKNGQIREIIEVDDAGNKLTTYYDSNGQFIMTCTGSACIRPRDDDMGGADNHPVIVKGSKPGKTAAGSIIHPKGNNDGGDDPRNPDATSTASGGRMIKLEQKVEGKQIEEGDSVVNWNKVLEINTKIRTGTN